MQTPTAARSSARSTPTARYDLVLADGTTVHARARRRRGARASRTPSSRSRRKAATRSPSTRTVDDELRAEGIARDLIRLLNDQRKAAGLEIADRIRVRLGATGRVEAAAHAHRDWIAREVLAVEFDVVAGVTDDAPRVDVDGDAVSVEFDASNADVSDKGG